MLFGTVESLVKKEVTLLTCYSHRLHLASRGLRTHISTWPLPAHVRWLCNDWLRPLPPKCTLQWIHRGLKGGRAHEDRLSACVLWCCIIIYSLRHTADRRESGLGALVSPLIATQFSKQNHWSYHYLISGALYAVNSALLWFVFRGKRQDGMPSSILSWSHGG